MSVASYAATLACVVAEAEGRGRRVRRFVPLAALLVAMLLQPDNAHPQRLAQRLNFVVTPPSPTVLGQLVSLGIRPAVPGTTYRYVATMSVTGTGMLTTGTSCAAPQTIGTGATVQWTPASGAYRLTWYGTRSLVARDSISRSYQVDPPNLGFLIVTVMQYTPLQPGTLTLSLRTNDRGAGHRYQWVVRFTSTPGTPPRPPVYWTGDTPVPIYGVSSYSSPLVVQPGTYNISARVGIHTGDPCRVSEVSVRSLNGQVIH